MLLSEQPIELSLLSALQEQSVEQPEEFVLAIGPEGGWTPEEVSLFGEQNWQPVTLGSTILRAETAAIAATAITAAWLQK